ncbi:hypothetical protein L2Z53_11990 (plasmid) [Macrococcoides canis]|nr:hypothetical protein [Macrococcus canis]UJS29056.1 hypothetical protein L2Z53_11990 [Macrococcus canis]
MSSFPFFTENDRENLLKKLKDYLLDIEYTSPFTECGVIYVKGRRKK